MCLMRIIRLVMSITELICRPWYWHLINLFVCIWTCFRFLLLKLCSRLWFLQCPVSLKRTWLCWIVIWNLSIFFVVYDSSLSWRLSSQTEYEKMSVLVCISEISAFHFQVSGRQKLHSGHFQLMLSPVGVTLWGKCHTRMQSWMCKYINIKVIDYFCVYHLCLNYSICTSELSCH